MTDLLIRGADLIGRGRSDLLIRNGRFVDPADAGSEVDTLDADGLVALPGLVDLHTHLREPGREDAETVESGTLAGHAAVSPRSWQWPTRLRSPTPQRRPSTLQRWALVTVMRRSCRWGRSANDWTESSWPSLG